MGSLFLLILYLVILGLQITLLVCSIKRGKRKYWIRALLLEIFSIIISYIFFNYYASLPGYGFLSGLSYLLEVLLSFGAGIFYAIMLFITVCTMMLVFEKHQKQQGKKYLNPVVSIIAVISIAIGILYLSHEIVDNWGKKEAVGTVINFEEVRSGTGETELWPIVRVYVDGEAYEDYFPISATEVGDSVKIYYYLGNEEKYFITPYITDNKIIYIPAFIIGILIIILRFKDDLFK